MSVCIHLRSRVRSLCVRCTEDRGAHRRGTRSRLEDREELRFLTMEDGEDSGAGPPQLTCFVELSAERIRRLAMLRKRKQVRKHVVESLHKPGINYAHFHVRFNCSLSD